MSSSPRPARWATLAAVSTSLGMAPFSVTTSGVALAPIGADLGAPLAGLQWVVGVFALCFAALLLPFGSLADRRGRRRLFIAGTLVFATASVVTGAAPSFAVLLAGRGLQGVAGAMIAASGVAILTDAFREPPARGLAFGVVGSVAGLALALGAVAGGPLVGLFGWRVALVAPALFALPSLALARHVRESRGSAGPTDYAGGVAVAVFLALAIAYGTEGPTAGWTTPRSIAMLAGAALSAVVFVVVEKRVAAPMIDLRVFRDPVFAGASLLVLSFTAVSVALMIFVPLYLQVAHRRAPASAGLWMLLMLVPGAAAPPMVARLGRRFTPRALLTAGCLLMSLGLMVAGARLVGLSPLTRLAVGLVVTGTGAGVVNGLIDFVAVSALPEAKSGIASGAFNAMRLVGDSVASVVPGAILTHALASTLARGSALGAVAGLEASRWNEAASAIITGQLARAREAAHGDAAFDAAARAQYTTAMESLLCVLAAVCLANAALCAFAFRRSSGEMQ